MSNKRPEIRIYGVPQKIYDDLKIISKDNGSSLSDFVKPKLREIVNKYYEANPHLRQNPENFLP